MSLKKISCLAIALVVVVMGGIFYFKTKRPVLRSSQVISTSVNHSTSTTSGCLSSEEYAEIPPSEESQTFYGPLITSSTVQIKVMNKGTTTIVSSFDITNVDRVYFNPVLRPCGIYVLREFEKNSLPGYDVQLWRYNYARNDSEFFNLFAITSSGAEENFYFPDFRIDPNEKYLALEQNPDEASDSIVIVDPKTTQNLFVLPISNIAQKNPGIIANVEFYPGGWSSNGRYFWFNFFEAADIYGFVRIDTTNWSYQAFAAPTTTTAGDAFNPDTGRVTYSINVAPWTADSGADQYYRNQALATGRITSFYIENLLTNQSYLVVTSTDPTYYFEPQWISDSVLQYTLPSGVTSTYVVK